MRNETNNQSKSHKGSKPGKLASPKVRDVIEQAEFQAKLQERLYKIDQAFRKYPLLWGNWYTPHHFPLESPGFHSSILKSVLNNRFVAIAAPRESAKSSIIAYLRPIHAICYKQEHFIVIISNTEDKAIGSLATIKEELKSNEKLKRYYKIKVVKDNESDTVFKHPDGFKIRFLCKGHKQMGSIRGEKFGAYRPTLILLDDVEDDELVRNPDRRRELQELFDEAVIPAIDKQTGKINAVGTILHDDSLMNKLISPYEYKEFKKFKCRALTEKAGMFYSLWNEKWTVKELQTIQRNKPSVFAKEYQNNPSYGSLGGIDKKDFRYFTIQESQVILLNDNSQVQARYNLSDCRPAISCDLAWETKREHDFSVIMAGLLTPGSDLLVDKYICKKGMRPDEIEEVLFAWEERYHNLTGTRPYIGFEKAKIEKVIKWFLSKAMKQRNRYLMLKDLSWGTDKIERIMSKLEPRYLNHSVYHRKGMGDLEEQLMRIRSTAHDDLADAEQGLVQLLQFPRKESKEESPGDMFMKLRQFTIDSKKKPITRFSFGTKKYKSPIQAITSIIG